MKKKNLYYGIITILVISLLGYVAYDQLWAGSPAGTPTTTTNYMNIQTNDGASLEDVSDLCQVDIYVPKSTSTFEDENDYYDLSLFELEINNEEAEDVNLDVSDYEAIWIVLGVDTTPGYWTEDWKLVKPNGLNTDKIYSVSHRASDVFCPTPVESDAGTDFGTTASGSFYTQNDGNYTFYFSFPTYTTTGYHWNSAGDWDIQGDWADLSAGTISRLRNENQWREYEAIFDLDDDTANHLTTTTGVYKDVTNIASIQITFNDTVSLTNGAVTNVNITLPSTFDEVDYVVDITSTYVYINFLETWNCYDMGVFAVPFEIETGDEIIVSDLDIGRLAVPGSTIAGSTFTSIEDIV